MNNSEIENSLSKKPIYGRDLANDNTVRICDAFVNESGKVVKLQVKQGKRYCEVSLKDLIKQCS